MRKTQASSRAAQSKLLQLALWAATACALAPATAAIAPGGPQSGASAVFSGNGELFVSVFDPVAKISYTQDLGVTVNDFFVWGQQDAGNQRFWQIADPNWTDFLARADAPSMRWSVLGFDTTGGTVSGGVRLFTTARQGDEARIATFTNQLFTNATGAAQAGTFFTAVNASGTHGAAGTAPDFTIHGNSVNADTEPGNGYFGSVGGLTSTLNGNAPFDNANRIGESSWFYYLTRSGPVQSGTVLVDEFDNLGYDGYWGLIFVDPTLYPDSPYKDSHLLSYTMPAYDDAAPAPLDAAGPRTEFKLSFRRAVALDDPGLVSTVPEPQTWALLAGGLLWLAGRARRMRQQSA